MLRSRIRNVFSTFSTVFHPVLRHWNTSYIGLYFVLLLIGIHAVVLVGRVLFRVEVVQAAALDRPHISSVFTPEVQHWSPLIYAWSSAYNLDPNLIATVIQIESCGDPTAVSRSGAQGLFQVMPYHFAKDEDTLEVLTNGRRGLEYLTKAYELAEGNPGLALAAYNGGHGIIKTGWAKWSAETRRYYEWGTGIYSDASKGLMNSPTVEKWLKAGGKSLCKRAAVNQLNTLH